MVKNPPLGLCADTAEVPGSIPGWGTMIVQAMRCSQKKKKKKERNPGVIIICTEFKKYFIICVSFLAIMITSLHDYF